MGPCCDLLMICSPRFSAYCGLMHATVLRSFANKQAPFIAQDSTRRKPSEVEGRKRVPGLRVTFISDKTYGPPRLLPYRNSYQRTACRANDIL
jgi:hypothetical protein